MVDSDEKLLAHKYVEVYYLPVTRSQHILSYSFTLAVVNTRGTTGGHLRCNTVTDVYNKLELSYDV